MRIYEISCMSSADDDDLDRILGGPVSNEVTPINNPAARRTCWASYRLPRTMLVSRRSCHRAKAGQGNCREEALEGLVYLSLMRYLCHIHALFSHVNNAGIRFTPANIYTRES